MLIDSVRVINYKGYRDSGDIKLTPGFNVIVGRNDAGKTALVEAMSLRLSPLPHRSLAALPTPVSPVRPDSEVRIRMSVTNGEFLTIAKERLNPFYAPGYSNHPIEIEVKRFLEDLEPSVTIDATWLRPPGNYGQFVSADLANHEPKAQGGSVLALNISVDGPPVSYKVMSNYTNVNWQQTAAGLLAPVLHERIYAFRAERLNIGDAPIANNPVLARDASNLAQVLHFLQSANPMRWDRFVQAVREVFPHVHGITVPPVSEGVRVLVWGAPLETERSDLAFSLADSGTGIGQVMAMLYIAITSEVPQTIIIDEPQSFLHPGAVRAVVEILKRYPKHQYVVVTHSAAVIAASDPSTLLLIKRTDAESVVEHLKAGATDDLKKLLRETGARFSDLFGADRVLWVEGPTEVECLPPIYARVCGKSLGRIAILPMHATDELTGKQARSALEVYRRLSTDSALIPPAVGFIFDRENRSQSQRDDLIERSKSLAHFTTRRMFENYLLDHGAIWKFIVSQGDLFSDAPIEAGVIRDWLNQHQWDKQYFDGKTIATNARTDEKWVSDVHGARLLSDLFDQLSGHRFVYRKVEHAPLLTEEVLKSNPLVFEDYCRVFTKDKTDTDT